MALHEAIGSNVGEVCLFPSVSHVIRGLVTFTDWWQPLTSSVLQVGGLRRSSGFDDGIQDGFLETIGQRSELSRRIRQLDERDRRILFLWYVRELPAHEVASEVRISRRQCFRRRSAALRALVDDEQQAA